MAINYRLSPEVHFPAHYMDCARAIQFARSHAKEWNIDPARVAATGGSAGAGSSSPTGCRSQGREGSAMIVSQESSDAQPSSASVICSHMAQNFSPPD